MKTVVILLLSAIVLVNCEYQPFSIFFSNFENYDKYTLPSVFSNEPGNKPVTVKTGALFLRMRDYCEKNKEFKVDMILRQNWTDARLTHSAPKPYKFDHEILNKIWTPDTFLVFDHNGKVNQPLARPVTLVKVSPDGNVYYSSK